MAAKKKTGARKGERPFLTKAKINRFLRAIGNGCTVKAACGIVGMSQGTFYKYRDEYRKGGAAKNVVEFIESIDRVRGESQDELLNLVIADAQRNTGVKSAQWLLERRHGMTQTVKQELSGPDGGPIKHDTSETKEAILAKLVKLAERHGAE
tara:strand:- start:73 stop:528 length:456 start_codon:yes stop_codon:yes gene_type:complete